MDAVGMMLMWLIGIVVAPVILYLAWLLLCYISKLPRDMPWITIILIFAVLSVLYMGMSHIVDKGYCIRDRKYFSEYSKEKMINDAIILLLNKKTDVSLGGYKKNQNFSEKNKMLDVANFKSFNDDCCHVYIGNVDDGSGSVRYFYKLNGDFYGYVELAYWQIRPNLKIDEEQKRVYQKVEKTKSYYGISRCGEVFEIPNHLYF